MRATAHSVNKVSTDTGEPLRPHPLVKAISMAEAYLQFARENVRDYECTLLKRERIDGELRNYEQMLVKYRSAVLNPAGPSGDVKVSMGTQVVSNNGAASEDVIPKSIYLRYLGPRKIEARCCTWRVAMAAICWFAKGARVAAF